MRMRAAELFESHKNVWILSLAAKDCVSKIGDKYSNGDAIYLAKIEDVKSWNEYSKEYDVRSFKDKVTLNTRWDAIYETEKDDIKMRSFEVHNKNNLSTDCGTGLKNCMDIKQILLSTTYFIFGKNTIFPNIDV